MTPGADRIVDAALELLDREGLDRLSTRRLAAALNIQGPSLYHHFRNKAELLGQMAASMLRQCLAPLDRSVDWDVWLRSLAHATRNMVLQRRDGARLLASSYPNEDMQYELVPGLAQPLIAAGFSVRAAREQVALMATFVLGWTINEQNERMRRLLGENVLDIDGAFANGVETLLSGMASRRDRKPRVSPAARPVTGTA
jgi:TetR/AcrR family tetracycline transcriptional repressor